MASQKRILNVTSNHRMKLRRAELGVEQCAYAWVEPGISVRTLNLNESRQARIIQAMNREALPYAELFGIKFEPSPSGIEATRREAILIREAITFALQA